RYRGQGAAVARADDRDRRLARLEGEHPEDGQRGQVDGVVGRQVGDEYAPEVPLVESGLHQLVADSGTGIDQVDRLADDAGSGDARTASGVLAGPPARAAGGAEGDDAGIKRRGVHVFSPSSAAVMVLTERMACSPAYVKLFFASTFAGSTYVGE